MLFAAKTLFDLIQICSDERLTKVDIIILDFVQAMNPFGDREIFINCRELSLDLGFEKTGKTVSRSLNKLARLKYLKIKRGCRGLEIIPCKLSLWLRKRIENHGKSEDEQLAEALKEQARLEKKYAGRPQTGTVREISLTGYRTIEAEIQGDCQAAPRNVQAEIQGDCQAAPRDVQAAQGDRQAAQGDRQAAEQIAESKAHQRFQQKDDLQDLKTKDFFLDSGKKNQQENIPEENIPEENSPESREDFSEESEDKLNSVVGKPETLVMDRSSAAPGHILAQRKRAVEAAMFPVQFEKQQRPIIRRPKFLYPEGEWLDDRGRLRSDFIRWMANRWKNQFEDKAQLPLEEIVDDVLVHFANQPQKLPIRWDAYCAVLRRKAENIEQRAATDFRLSSQDAQEYAIATVSRPTNSEEAATDFSIPSLNSNSCARSSQSSPVEPQEVLAGSASGSAGCLMVKSHGRSRQQISKVLDGSEVSEVLDGSVLDDNCKPIFNQSTVEAIAHKREEAEELKNMSLEQRVSNCQRIGQMIESLVKRDFVQTKKTTDPKKRGAEIISEKSKQAEALLKNVEYTVNSEGYLIDEEGEF